MPFYRDMELICRGCGEAFIFTAGEQEFYADKGFLHEPTRCPRCRSRRDEGGSRPGRPSERKPERRDERR
jgi:DNA-directed RNA polymerase subunit RPC12/RpoP